MTLDQLRVFVAVAQREHITRAAEALNMTQSAVSAAVSSLEREYGTKFFHRIGRGIVLTEGGRLFFDEARAILARVEATHLAMREFVGLARGRLGIMASHTIASYLLPGLLVDFRRAYPGVHLAVSVGNSEHVKSAILDGTIELGFTEGPQSDVADPELAFEIVAHDPLALIVAPQHPWAAVTRLTAPELARGQWVVREDGSGTRASFFNILDEFGISRQKIEITIELPSNHAVLAAVAAGAGPAILSGRVCQAAITAGTIVRIPVALRPRAFYAVQHMDRYRSRAVAAFLEIIRNHAVDAAAVPEPSAKTQVAMPRSRTAHKRGSARKIGKILR